MADEDGDKTEAPTAKRRQEARDEGRVAKSQDLTAALLLVGLTILLGVTGGDILKAMGDLLAAALGGRLVLTGERDAAPLLLGIMLHMMRVMMPLLVGTILIAIVANVAQVGFHPNLKKLQPKLSLNPMTGLKKLFGGGGRGPVQLGMNLLKLLLVGFVAYSAVTGQIAQILGMAAARDLFAIFTTCSQIVYDITLRIGLVLLVLALVDFGYQKYKHEKDLKMTKQQVKDEMKRMDGDPQLKARRRQIQLQQAQKRLATSVPTADVIVTNPTHYAIALKYDATGDGAPRVVAKGGDFLAMKIRELAAANGIPVIERPPLARALYKLCDVGQEIPEEFYAAVAEILAYVYELTGKSKRRAAG